jgi:hypothetical protein
MEGKMADANEPGAAVQAILDQLIDRIKSRRPIRSDKKPAELGFVYSQLVLGMMIDPEDYKAPWSPAGGASIRDAIDKGHAPANTGPPPATNAGAGGPAVGAGGTAPPAGGVAPAGAGTAPAAVGAAPAVAAAPTGLDPKYMRAMDAAFKTSMLVDCTTDLFYMKNWYLVGNKKHSISDGTIDGQAGGEDSLCPMRTAFAQCCRCSSSSCAM